MLTIVQFQAVSSQPLTGVQTVAPLIEAFGEVTEQTVACGYPSGAGRAMPRCIIRTYAKYAEHTGRGEIEFATPEKILAVLARLS
jgi:hypothetical protein